jgi:hypothetical protein
MEGGRERDGMGEREICVSKRPKARGRMVQEEKSQPDVIERHPGVWRVNDNQTEGRLVSFGVLIIL